MEFRQERKAGADNLENVFDTNQSKLLTNHKYRDTSQLEDSVEEKFGGHFKLINSSDDVVKDIENMTVGELLDYESN